MAVLHIMGCRLNHAEGAAIRAALRAERFDVTDAAHPQPDEPYLLHTCAVTATAQQEALRHLRSAARTGARPILVSGCTANIAETDSLFEAGAHAVIARRGTQYECRFREETPEVVASALAQCVASALQFGVSTRSLPAHTATRAPVKIQDGCSFRCSYCIVPDARGTPRSRPFDDILRECRRLVEQGYRELVLTGVNVSCWNENGKRFSDVVHAVSEIPGIARVRMSSVEPHTTEREIIDLLAAKDSKLCRTLHYPLQSGSDRILQRMRRRYTRGEYCRILDEALARIPSLGLGADIITGFPGETDRDFANTESLVQAYPFSNLHIFPYSERPGTPAAEFPDSVPVHIRRERARRLIAVAEEKRRDFAATFVGKSVDVLIERVSPDGVGSGWSGEYLPVRIPRCTAADIGTLRSAIIAEHKEDTLFAS